MGSFFSTQNATNSDVGPKTVEVLPATESWSTLDAFQATVKKDEHHELINRSKTQRSLMRTNSFSERLKRTVTFNTIPAHVSSFSKKQASVRKKPVHAKTQFNLPLNETNGDDEADDFSELPSIESQSRLNARRGTHFYQVRKAMVNRRKLQKLDSLVSEDRIQSSTSIHQQSGNKRVQSSSNLQEMVTDKVDTSNNIHTLPEVTSHSVIQNPERVNHSTVASLSNVTLENKVDDVQQKKKSSASTVQPSGNESRGASLVEPSTNAFKIDPTPDAKFAPDPQVTDQELKCRSTVAKLASSNSNDSARYEIEQLLQQWKDSGFLSRIETHALNVTPSQVTVAQLADSLASDDINYVKAVGGNELHIQIAKAYCIYVWIANNISYDVDHWNDYLEDDSSSMSNTEAEEVLENRTAVCAGYANLFKTLGHTCGLKVGLIHGHAKAWKSLSEERPDADKPFMPGRQNSHVWNSVVFGSVQCLLDCTFASGYVTSSMNFCKSFNRYYFAVPPQKLILTHWPSSDALQLLCEPLTLESFQPLIPFPASADGLGIEPETWSEVIEVVDDPVVCVKFKCRDNVRVLSTLIAANECKDHEVPAKGKEILTFVTKKDNETSIRATPPNKGQFVLNIYACASAESPSSQKHRLVLSYLIQNKREVMQQVGYPVVNSTAALDFNLRLLYWNAPQRDFCCENQGKLDVVFRARPDLQFYHYITPGKPGDAMAQNPPQVSDQCHFNTITVQNEDGDPNLYMLRGVFPAQGWWTLYLYAKKSDLTESNQTSGYALVATYSVYVGVGNPSQSYPNILSPCISMLQPEPISASGNEIFSFIFNSSKCFDYHSYLTYNEQTAESVNNLTVVESIAGTNKCKLNVIFPRPGKWYVHVFGKDITDSRQVSYSGLFVLQLQVDGLLKNTTFPKVNRAFATTLNVKCPNSGSITFQDDGSPFNYKVIVPEGSIDFIHSIKPHSSRDVNFNDNLLQHCSSLSFEKCKEDSKFSVCSLNAVFPWAGTWTVQLFAASTGSNRYEYLIETKVVVNTPTPNVCFIKLHPPFYNLQLSIPDKFLSYNPSTDKCEIEIPFKAPECIQFVWNMEFVKSGEKFIHQAIVHHQDDSTLNRVLQLIFPKPGEWLFHLYAKTDVSEKQGNDHNYQSVMELRINVSSFNNESGFPHTFEPFRSVFGMKLNKEMLPLVSKVTNIPTTVSIPFYCQPNVKLWYDIDVDSGATSQPAAQLKSTSECCHEVLIDIDKRGKWTVTLYAQNSDSSRKNWTAVLKHVFSSD